MTPHSTIAAGVNRVGALANQIASLPAVQQIIRAEEQRQLDLDRQARRACMERLKEAEHAESLALPAFDAAVSALRLAEAEVEARRRDVFVAEDALGQARQLVSSANYELVKKHGEGAVMLGLHRLHKRIDDADRAIKILAENGFTVTAWGLKHPRPGVSLQVEIETDKRTKAVSALEKMKALVNADMAPVEIEAKVEQLLTDAGLGRETTSPDASSV